MAGWIADEERDGARGREASRQAHALSEAQRLMPKAYNTHSFRKGIAGQVPT